MQHHISKQLLFSLRNDINLQFLVKDVFRLPSKFSDGQFRFICPICHEFRTAINPKTNLARCFLCQRNFNAIDLTIIVRNLPFRDAVRFLLPLLAHVS